MKRVLKIMSSNPKHQKSPALSFVRQQNFLPANVRNLFESTSFVIPNRNNTNNNNNNNNNTQKLDILKNSSTQTSRTMVALDRVENCRMSPDSLSPKTDYYQNDFDEDDEEVPLNGIVPNTSPRFNRKTCVLRYLHKPIKRDEKEKSQKLPENSLTKAFLEKRHRTQDIHSPRVTRSNFLQQTSPLRKIIHAEKQQQQHFKSHSYAAFSDNQKLIPESAAAVSTQHRHPNPTRFFVKQIIKEKPSLLVVEAAAAASQNVKSVKYFCEKELALNLNSTRSPKSTINNKNRTFMSPTFSSEQKNKMREIKTVTKLISPTRRGRSASPKASSNNNNNNNNNNNVKRLPSLQKKVPYIDKSSSSIFHGMGDSGFELNLESLNLGLSDSTIQETISESHPEHELVQAITKLRDLDWNTSLRGVAEIVELCRTIDSNIIYPRMVVINQRIIDMLKSSRSHVCRTTCKAVGHLFEYIKDTRRPEFDEIVDTLLCRTADSNKFIRHDANLALDCMVTHIPILHAVRSLCAKGPEHKNGLVRIATARLVVCAVVIASPNYVLNPNNSDHTRRRIIQNLVKFLNDKTLEARKYGERLYKLLCGDRMFDIYMRRYLEKETILKLKACFKSNHHRKNVLH